MEIAWTIKYEEICLHAYNTVSNARAGIARRFTFYNQRRPHGEHGGERPDAMYFGNLEMKKAA